MVDWKKFGEKQEPQEVRQEEQSEEGVETRKESELGSFKLQKFSDMIQRRGLKILVKGQAGVGKTTFSLTCPSPIFFIDTEFAVGRFKGSNIFKEAEVDVVNLFEMNEKSKEMDSLKIIKQLDDILYYLHSAGKDKYKTVVFDSVTSLWIYLQDWLRYEVLRIGGTLNIKNVPTDRRDWGRANSKYYALMQTLISGEYNVVATVQEQPTYDREGNLIGYKPSMQKNSEFYFDFVLRLKTVRTVNDQQVYIATIEKARGIFGKNIVGKIIEFPSFEKLLALLNE